MRLTPRVCDDAPTFAPFSKAILHPIPCGRRNDKSARGIGFAVINRRHCNSECQARGGDSEGWDFHFRNAVPLEGLSRYLWVIQ